MDTDREYLTVEEAANELNLSEKTVYRAIWNRNLKAEKAGRVWRIPKTELKALVFKDLQTPISVIYSRPNEIVERLLCDEMGNVIPAREIRVRATLHRMMSSRDLYKDSIYALHELITNNTHLKAIRFLLPEKYRDVALESARKLEAMTHKICIGFSFVPYNIISNLLLIDDKALRIFVSHDKYSLDRAPVVLSSKDPELIRDVIVEFDADYYSALDFRYYPELTQPFREKHINSLHKELNDIQDRKRKIEKRLNQLEETNLT